MKPACLFVFITLIYFGCESETDLPQLSPGYLQPIFIEIRKIDSTAKVLKFIPGDEKFEYFDKRMNERFLEVGSYKLNGDPVEVIETEKTITSDSAITRYFLAGERIIEKIQSDSDGTVIRRVEYNKDLVDQIIKIRKKENDTIKIRYRYDEKKRLIRERRLLTSGNVYERYEFRYHPKGNIDYVYTIVALQTTEFDKFEFNRKNKQYIISRFDNNKNLKWLMYRECDSSGIILYEERYTKENKQPGFRKEAYTFNPEKEIISLKSYWPITKHESRFDFVYPQRDSMNNWTEQTVFEDDKYFMITKRTIKYN